MYNEEAGFLSYICFTYNVTFSTKIFEKKNTFTAVIAELPNEIILCFVSLCVVVILCVALIG